MEIEAGKFFVVLYRGIIVCLSGVDFVCEISEVYSPAVTDDCGPPQALVLSKPDALIARSRISLFRVPGVLSDSCQTEVGPAIVEAAAVYVVDDVSFGSFNELAVHE